MIVEQAGDSPENTEIYETLKMYDGLDEESKKRFRKILETERTEE